MSLYATLAAPRWPVGTQQDEVVVSEALAAPERSGLDRLLGRWTTQVPTSLFHDDKRPADDQATALQWLGTAGFRLQCGGTHLWMDPHLSRHSPRQLMGRIAPNLERIRADVDIAHAVAIGHSHFDHAIDAPAIAKLRGALVYGSSDTLHYCRANGVPEDQLHELRGDGESFPVGPMALRAVRSEHSPMLLGRIPLAGRIEGPVPLPTPVQALRVGQVFGLHVATPQLSVYHVGSAALIDAELKGMRADVVLCCTIGRHATPRFVHRVLDALQPRLLIPCHWDQFWTPLAAPLRQIPGNDLLGFLDEVASHPRAPQVRVLPPRGWLHLGAPATS